MHRRHVHRTWVGTSWERMPSSRVRSCLPRSCLPAANSGWEQGLRGAKATAYGTESQRFESSRARSVVVMPVRGRCRGWRIATPTAYLQAAPQSPLGLVLQRGGRLLDRGVVRDISRSEGRNYAQLSQFPERLPALLVERDVHHDPPADGRAEALRPQCDN